MRYRTRPVEVEARKVEGSWQDLDDIAAWCGGYRPLDAFETRVNIRSGIVAYEGDYIVKDDLTTFALPAHTFEARYVPVGRVRT